MANTPRYIEESDELIDTRRKWDTLAILAYIVTAMVALAVLAPYWIEIPEKNVNLITQGQTTLYAGWMLILAFYYKSRVNNPLDAETISMQAKTIKDAQTTLSAVGSAGSPEAMSLKPGETAVATATPSGTIIKKDEPHVEAHTDDH